MKLWLDDIRAPWKYGHVGVEWARTAQQAIALLKTGRVTWASLDHDLSLPATMGNWTNEVTGYDVVLWLEAHPECWPKDGVFVHSLNPAGKARMQEVIDRHNTRALCADLDRLDAILKEAGLEDPSS